MPILVNPRALVGVLYVLFCPSVVVVAAHDESGAIDLNQFAVRPFDSIFRGHALYGLGVHIDDNVFGYDLGRLARRRALVACEAPRARRLLVRQHDGVIAPQLVVFPICRRTYGEALL